MDIGIYGEIVTKISEVPLDALMFVVGGLFLLTLIAYIFVKIEEKIQKWIHLNQ